MLSLHATKKIAGSSKKTYPPRGISPLKISPLKYSQQILVTWGFFLSKDLSGAGYKRASQKRCQNVLLKCSIYLPTQEEQLSLLPKAAPTSATSMPLKACVSGHEKMPSSINWMGHPSAGSQTTSSNFYSAK